ncbi:hypothetical protein FRC02_000492 [Tulasnella sp. 418]|nr:hypothetical protein FRC02_000492 [Tulasnella sp. 418]
MVNDRESRRADANNREDPRDIGARDFRKQAHSRLSLFCRATSSAPSSLYIQNKLVTVDAISIYWEDMDTTDFASTEFRDKLIVTPWGKGDEVVWHLEGKEELRDRINQYTGRCMANNPRN